MRIIIVDDKDSLINYKERNKNDFKKDIYRVSALWIINSKGEILLAKRAYNKKQNHCKGCPAVAGTVEKGESYKSNIVKEAEEELGIKNIKLKKGKKDFVKGKYKHFIQWFNLVIDKDINKFKYLEEEVAEIKWFTKNENLNIIKNNSDEMLEEIKDRIKIS